MTCLIHYSKEDGNHTYTIVASTQNEAQRKLKSFLEHNKLQQEQVTIEMISAN